MKSDSSPIQLYDVRKSFNGHDALAPVTLSFRSATTTVLIGPSGCGKSTLLRVMMGLIQPSAGQVEISGVKLTHQNALALRHGIGYVIQDGGLFPHLSAASNVTLLARHLNWTEQKIVARVQQLAALVRLELGTLQRYPRELSGGQQQRVALMRALMLDPPILLLDEPLGALDPVIRFELQEELKAIFSQLKKTVVMVTHDMSEAAFFGDEIILMRAGHIVQRGAPMDLLERPADAFVTAFIRAQRALPQPAHAL
ncbi:MAG: ATP-binding cassette domain-containing protein [Burkholderiales bacterium]